MDHNLLGSIPLFARLSTSELAELASLLKTVKVDAQQPVFWIGDEGSDFFIVQLGRVTLTFPDDTGREMTLAAIGPGQFFGEISLLDGGPRTATARAQSDCTLLTLGRTEFLDFLKVHLETAVHIITVLGQRQREMLDKLRGVINVNTVIEERSTRWQRAADTIAAVSASQPFVLIHLAWFFGWMVFNAIIQIKWGAEKAFDPYPFGLLTMIVSLEAIFLSIFVLVSQNRSGEKDRIRADLDYQVNLKAQHEIMQLHQKLDRLAATVSGGANAVDPNSQATSAVDAAMPH